MNMNRSLFRSNLKSTPNQYQPSILQIQTQIIDNHMEKSYIYQMANKKKKNQNTTMGTEQKPSAIRSSKSQEKKYRIFKSVLRNIPKKDRYTVLMSNLGAKQQGFSCCNPNAARQLVTLILSPFKDLKITNKSGQILYQFNFNTIFAKINQLVNEASAFTLEITDKILLKFQIQENETTRDIQELKKSLTSMIDESLGKQFNMQDLKSLQEFEKRKYCPNIEFVQNCETGDIILFRGNLFWAKVQRFFTFSDYDHVGVIYKDPVHGILIFQATSTSGICLTPWKWVIKYKWYQHIDRIVWRKLENVQRTFNFIETIQQFILQKLGKTYHISFQKLWANKSVIMQRTPPPVKENNSNNNNVRHIYDFQETTQSTKLNQQQMIQQGYFCSELAAKFYKHLNLLPTQTTEQNYKPSNNFYPYHFTQKFDLHLKKGRLADEAIIHFNPEAIKNYYNQIYNQEEDD